jgi:hypothetical protein
MPCTRAQTTTLKPRASSRESPRAPPPLTSSYHAWESVAKDYLAALDPSTITTIDTSFTRMARRFREPGEERLWRAAGRQDGAGSGTGLGQGDDEAEEEEVSGMRPRIVISRERA